MAEKELTPASLALLETNRFHADECARFDREPHPPCTCGLATRLVEVEKQSGAITDEAQRKVALELMDRNSDLAAQLQAADAQLVQLREALEAVWSAVSDEGEGDTPLVDLLAPDLYDQINRVLNSTAEDNKEALARVREEAVKPLDWEWANAQWEERNKTRVLAQWREMVQRFYDHDDRVCDYPGDACPLRVDAWALLTENKPKSEAGENRLSETIRNRAEIGAAEFIKWPTNNKETESE